MDIAPKLGRPRKYPADVANDGAPILSVRLDPELREWVRAKGGVQWVRRLLQAVKSREQGG